jgi:hypothetical protein
MAGQDDGRIRRRSRGLAGRAAKERDVRLAVLRLQDSAYANLRSAVANVAIFFGFVGIFALAVGAVQGVSVVPTTVLVLAGLTGAGYYLARHRPGTGVLLLLVATVLLAVGLVALVMLPLVTG